MKTIQYYTALILIASLFLGACQGSKHFAKMASKQEKAGLMNEAAGNYYTALQKKRSNIDAQIGMKTTGQLMLNNMLNDFAKQKSFGTSKDAVYAYHKARDYRDKIQGVGITLLLADFYESDYQAVKGSYLVQLYDEGTTLLEDQKFPEAETKFAEIRKLDPNYKDASELGNIAYLEPLYTEGKKEMTLGNYRSAHGQFEKVIARKADYKDAAYLKKQCLEKGIYTIALMNFENASGTPGLDARVSAYALTALTNVKDPFMRVVDRGQMEAIIREQQLQLSGVIDQNTAVKVGELIGAQALLTGTVLSYSEKKGSLRTKQRDGYASYQERVLNKTDGKYYIQTMYKPTTYTEYYNSNGCTVSFQYKLVNLSTGEIIKTEIIQKELNDEVLYGKFDGDVNTLFPAGQGGPNLNAQDKRAILGLMSGRQDLQSPTQLSNTLFGTVSSQLSGSISNVVKELVK